MYAIVEFKGNQYKAEKEAFSQIEGKIPTIRELNDEYDKVLREKKMTYAEYREAQREMKEWQTAKYNIDQFYKTEEMEHQENQKKKDETSL